MKINTNFCVKTFSVRTIAAAFVLLGMGVNVSLAEWQPHQIKVGDGQGGYTLKPAQIQSVGAPGSTFFAPYGMVKMDNGRLAMIAGRKVGTNEWHTALTFSNDEGNTWSAPQDVPGVTGDANAARASVLTYHGGSTLSFVIGFKANSPRYISTDYGQTFPTIVNSPSLPGGRYYRAEGNEAVDYDANGNATKIMSIGYNWLPGHGRFPRGDASAFFRYSTDGGLTWQGEVTPPEWKFDVKYNGTTYTRGATEGSVVRAANGDLVASLRTDMPPQYYPGGDDSCMGTAISISHDEGQTWSELNHLYSAGRHHGNLQRTPDGDLVLTIINRHDIRDEYHPEGYPDSDMIGATALVSHDHGATWNQDREVTLDEFSNPATFPKTRTGHIGAVVLDDGTMISAYGNYINKTAVLVKWDPATAVTRHRSR